MAEFYILLAAILVAMLCASAGSFLMVRQMAMVGDAISHSVLPGIVVGYLLSNSRSSLVALPAAMLTGLLVTLCIEWLHRKWKVQSDAAIGLVFTGLFSLGIILLTAFASQVDLDQDCVLYGDILFIPFDTFPKHHWASILPRPVWILVGMNALTVGILLLGFRRFTASAFDHTFARVRGLRPNTWHLVLMSLVSAVSVVAFESVGSILVLALMIVPAATARLFVNRMQILWALSVGFAIISALAGYYVAKWQDVSVSASIAVVAGILFGGSALLRRRIL